MKKPDSCEQGNAERRRVRSFRGEEEKLQSDLQSGRKKGRRAGLITIFARNRFARNRSTISFVKVFTTPQVDMIAISSKERYEIRATSRGGVPTSFSPVYVACS